MKKSKRIILILLALGAILVIASLAYGWYLKPKYEGKIKLKNIQENTAVYFDEFGVPHIYAATSKDAMEVLGYVHAQDRLWQMELLRRIAPGRLSEIFGSLALKSDLFFSGIGIDEASDKAIAALDKKSQYYQLTLAYLDGINQYMENAATPIEFQLLGVKKEKFTLKDVYNIFGYMSFSFAMAQKTDPLLTDIREKYGMDYLKDLGIEGSFNFAEIKKSKKIFGQYSAISQSITAILEQSPIAPFIGSNGWVIAPKRTKNGKVIFANDPHIGFSQPGTWYEAHLITPDFELYGSYLAGAPFPLLGHNRDYVYGLTMFENDDVDFYLEENKMGNANLYKTPDGFESYAVKKKTIKVKDTTDVVQTVKVSRHGPIVNNLIEGLATSKPVAMSWIYTQQPNKILEAIYILSHSKRMNDFQQGVAMIAAPGLNVMYGDAKGNVAWWATGKLYKHNPGVNSNFILDGTTGKEDIKEYLDFSKNPSALNPKNAYVYSANSQPEPIDGFLYPGYYLPDDRAKRITQLLGAKPQWDKKAASAMIVDNISAVAVDIVEGLILNLNLNSLSKTEKESVGVLKSWKGTNNLNDVAPTIYNKWIYFYLKNTFEDELGKSGFKRFLGTHLMKQMLAKQIDNGKSLWWDNIVTKNRKESRKDIVVQSFKEAVLSLQKQLGNSVSDWTWNKVHVVEYQHPLGSVKVLRRLFNVGPFAVSGSNEVINNQFFDYSDDEKYIIKGGPSTRRIVDFSDIENSLSVLPTGQSGNFLSPHYSDQTKIYNEGKFRKMKLNKKEIVKTSTKLIFIPSKN